MELVAIGGDLRYAHMVRLARQAGISAGTLALERAGVDGVHTATWEDVRRAEYIVMPNPFVNGPVVPLAEQPFALEYMMQNLRPYATLMLFGANIAPDDVQRRHRVVHLARDEVLTWVLARQTAEGAIHAATKRAAYELFGCPVLIIGYGRIAQSLRAMLYGYGAHIVVAARREEARLKARAVGAVAVDLMQMETLLPGQRIVFSTPPQRVLDERRIALMHAQSLLIDLSSPPYGVDLEAALARGINAFREPALPGRYCPESAGAAMLDAVCRAMKGDVDHDG